jgi:hypothetical protein
MCSLPSQLSQLTENYHIHESGYYGKTVYFSRIDQSWHVEYLSELARFVGMKVERFEGSYPSANQFIEILLERFALAVFISCFCYNLYF